MGNAHWIEQERIDTKIGHATIFRLTFFKTEIPISKINRIDLYAHGIVLFWKFKEAPFRGVYTCERAEWY